MRKMHIFGLLFLLLHFQQAFAQQAADFEWEVDDRQEVAIIAYTGTLTTVTIPGEISGLPVTAIDNNKVFTDRGLTSVIIPDCIRFIGSYAFNNNRLTSIDLPEKLDFNGPGAFANNRLTSVAIPNGVWAVGSGAFARNRLDSVILPDSMRIIDAAAFAHNRLTSVAIPGGVTEIGFGAFADNPLVRITIGANVDLRLEAFGDCGFNRAYTDGGRLAGTYTRTNTESTVWTLEE